MNKYFWQPNETALLLDAEKSFRQLRDELPHRTPKSIRYKSKQLGIERKNRWIRNSVNCKELLEDQEFCDVINGELLGDGCIINIKGGKNYTFSYCTINQEYINYLHRYIAEGCGKSKSAPFYEV